jgi:hypothetical protein
MVKNVLCLFSMDKLEISSSGVDPLLIGVTASFTFIALFLGFLFTKRQIDKRFARLQTQNEATKQSEPSQKPVERLDEPEEEEGDELSRGQWPGGKEFLK